MADARPKTDETKPRADQSRKLKNGAPAHVFTPEEAARGAKRSAEVRRERAKTHSARMREAIERKERQLHKALLEKACEGNVQAAALLLSYAYGLPAKSEPERLELAVEQGTERRGIELAAVLELARDVGVDDAVDVERKRTA